MGAIYGHFSSKEDLLISATEAAPVPAWATAMNDQSLPLRERLAEFSRALTASEAFTDKALLAMDLEFLAALLRSPDDLRRYRAVNGRALAELAEADHDQPLPGTTPSKSGPSARRCASDCRSTSTSPRTSSPPR
jgi:AcrR family transcriptional regulator